MSPYFWRYCSRIIVGLFPFFPLLFLLFAPVFDPEWTETWIFLVNLYYQYFDLNIYIFIGLIGFPWGTYIVWKNNFGHVFQTLGEAIQVSLVYGLLLSFLSFVISQGSTSFGDIALTIIASFVFVIVGIPTILILYPTLGFLFIGFMIGLVIFKILDK